MMKSLRQLPESERKKLFWVIFFMAAPMAIIVWVFVFFAKDIERFQNVKLPSVSSPDFSEQTNSFKELRNALKENITAFGDFAGDVKSFGDLTKEEEQKLGEWARTKEGKGEKPTFEETVKFLEELRSTGVTTMPLQNQISNIKNQNGQ